MPKAGGKARRLASVCDVGGFFAVYAVRDATPQAVAGAVVDYCAVHGVPAEGVATAELGEPERADAAQVWPAHGGWTAVWWPGRNSLQGVARWSSGELGALVSAIDLFDGDFWNHVLWRDGAELDRFSSCPDYFTRDRAEIRLLKQAWAGRPDVVAAAVGRPDEQVAPYLLHPYSSGFFGRRLARRRPLPGDEYELGDPWVLVDFWRRLGIVYPGGEEAPTRCVRFGAPGADKLPSDGPSL